MYFKQFDKQFRTKLETTEKIRHPISTYTDKDNIEKNVIFFLLFRKQIFCAYVYAM